MSEKSDGIQAPADGAKQDEQNRRHDRERRRGPRESNFTGKCEDLKNNTYDVIAGKDTFLKTTREIAEYVGCTFDDAGEFRTGLVDMKLPELIEPVAPSKDASFAELEKWRLAIKRHENNAANRKKNANRVYALTLGQCSQALRNRMEASDEWNKINSTSDVIKLLELIQKCMMQRETRQYSVHAIVEAKLRACTYKQGRHTSNHDYYERFKDNVTTIERLGGTFGIHESCVQEILTAKNISNLTSTQRKEAEKEAQDRFLAVLFLENCDKHRYGDMVVDIQNNFTRKKNTYPLTLTSAYDYLVNFKNQYSQMN
jgi:hypothetical protein